MVLSFVLSGARGIGFTYLATVQIADAFVSCRQLDPNLAWAQAQIGWICAVQGMYPQAIAECEKIPPQALAITAENQFVALSVAWVYAVAGRRAEAEKTLENIRRLSTREYIEPYMIAVVYWGLGDKNQAIE